MIKFLKREFEEMDMAHKIFASVPLISLVYILVTGIGFIFDIVPKSFIRWPIIFLIILNMLITIVGLGFYDLYKDYKNKE